MKKLFAATVSIAVILSACTLGVARVAASTTAGSSFAQSEATRLKFVPRFIRVANKRLRYTIKAKYPQAVGAKDPRIMKLNRVIRDLMTREVNDFKKDFKTPGKRMGAVGSDYNSDYSVRHSRNNIVSIAFYVDTYFEGAAHGNHNYLVFNYDLNTGRQIKLADLFKPKSNYLDAIAAYSIKSLTEKLKDESDADWIKSGAEAKDENYKNWNITSRGLEIGFDPYQVAAYVYGPQEVLIPYDALKDVIDPDGPLGRIVSNRAQAGAGPQLPDRPVKRMDTRSEAIPVTRGYGAGTGPGIGPGIGEGNGFGRGSGNETVSASSNGPVDYSSVFFPRDVNQKARIISRPEPTYTEEARKNHVSGTVVLRFVLTSQGQVINVRAVSGLPNGLTERAIGAARQIKFVPAMKDGRPVSQYAQLEYNFNPD